MLNKLPIEIFREHIMPYTYNPQPKELCRDIRSFHYIREYLYKFYHDRWEIFEPGEYINWLENDIIRFLNDDKATMWGYVENYVEKISRLFLFKNKDKKTIRQFIHTNIMKFQPNFSIRTFLGLLTPDERIKLVNFTIDFTFNNHLINDNNILNFIE